MTIRAIVFDLDGTLADTLDDIARAVNFALEAAGLPPRRPEEVASFLGHGVEQLVGRAIGRKGHPLFRRTLDEFVRFRRRKPAELCRLYPGVKETLEKLLPRPMAILSNGRMEMVRAVTEKLEIARFFKTMIAGDREEDRKPSPRPLLELSREFGVPPGQCLMVGDMPPDMLAGRAAGFQTCAVTYGYGRREELAEAGAETFIDAFGRLLDMVAAGSPEAK